MYVLTSHINTIWLVVLTHPKNIRVNILGMVEQHEITSQLHAHPGTGLEWAVGPCASDSSIHF